MTKKMKLLVAAAVAAAALGGVAPAAMATPKSPVHHLLRTEGYVERTVENAPRNVGHDAGEWLLDRDYSQTGGTAGQRLAENVNRAAQNALNPR